MDVPCNLQRVVEDSTTRCRSHGTSTTAFHRYDVLAYHDIDDERERETSGVVLSTLKLVYSRGIHCAAIR